MRSLRQLQSMLLMDNSSIGKNAFRQLQPMSPAHYDYDEPPEGHHSECWQSHFGEDSVYMGKQ